MIRYGAGYRLGEALHEGRSSVVYRAVRDKDGRRVVLKALGDRWQPWELKRLEREYELGRRLDVPALLKPLALESRQGTPVLVLEDFEGRSLAHLGVRLDLARILHIGSQLAAALATLHAKGLVHADVKPANVLVRPGSDEVRLIDLGLASALSERQPPTAERLIEGSLPYLSPEQTGRTGWPMDTRSDLYSLGVTLYELCAGRLPFQADDPPGWVHCHLARVPPSLAEVAPGTPAVFSDIVAKLLAKSPEDRYQSALGLHADLERCLASLTRDGRIEPFALALRDVSARFQVPGALHGREEEVAAIHAAFDRMVASGSPELVLVSGYAGVGKTSVIGAAREPMARRGRFLAGKFDQHRRDVPYSGLTDALRGLVRAVLAEGEERVTEWRGRLTDALGNNGRVVASILPELEVLLGPQPPVAELPPAEARSRFHLVFRRFLGAFALEERPLALFLDDLQWADAASLELLADVLTHPGTRHLLAIGAYRDNEVTPSHPLAEALAGVRKAGLAVHEVALAPLAREHVGRLVAGAMLRTPREVEPLTLLVQEKTAGNPFFAIQLLTSLREEGLIQLDPEELAWRCDVGAARARGYSENVVELMVARLKRLTPEAQELAQLAACVGSAPDVETLALLRERSREETHRDLRELVGEGLLARADDAYAFSHDRVQQAAYALVPQDRRPEMHLRIGRLLLAHTPPDLLAERAFEIVNQLNRGIDLVTDPEERESLARLDAVAGRRARASSAYASARTYLEAAVALSPEEAWGTRHEETFALHLELAECEYLAGGHRRSEETLDALRERAWSDLHRARICAVRVGLHLLSGRFEDAWATAAGALALLGVTLPERREEIPGALEAESRDLAAELSGRSAADLAGMPAIGAPEQEMIARLFIAAGVSAYNARPEIWPLLRAKSVRFSLRHGSTLASLFLAMYGAELAADGDMRSAQLLVEASRLLSEQSSDPWVREQHLACHAMMINHWRSHMATGLAAMGRFLRAAQERGALEYAGIQGTIELWTRLESGGSLRDVLAASDRHLAFAREIRNEPVEQTIRLMRQFIASLEGSTRERGSFDDDTFSEAACLAVFAKAGFTAGITYRHILKQMAAFTYGRYREAFAAAAALEPAALEVAKSYLYAATHHFYRALTAAALHPGATAEEQQELARTLHEELRRHRLWAESCPANFQNRHALLAAEVARVEGRDLEAARSYEEAIRSARDNGFVQNEALANEIAARFYEERGIGTAAQMCLQHARSCYARWGALGKVADLDRRHPQLFGTRGTRASDPLATYAVRQEHLDVLSMAKASQAISRELVLPDLVRTLVRTVVEQGGARKGAIVLARAGQLHVEAQARLAPSGLEVELRSSPLGECQDFVPRSLVELAARTKTQVVLGGAEPESSPEGALGSDEYLARARPRSALCLPLLKQGELAGVLYLENDLVTGAFTPERLIALELLAAQAAISLENASLVEKEQAARAAAEDARNRCALLAEAGALLSESLDHEETLAQIAQLCVRSICDWCVIDLREGEEIRRVGGAHADPAKEPLLRELQRRYPPRRESNRPGPRVLRTREPVLAPEVSEQQIRRECDDEEHARLVRELGMRSAITVPLVARGHSLGALSLVSCAPGRRYGPAELALAQDLASRAAMAIDNARLYREALSLSEAERRRAESEAANRALQQQAVALEAGKRAREEVLAVVSHDLRSPLSSIGMSAAVLERMNPEGPQAEMARLISRSATRMGRLADDLLDFSAIEAGRLSLTRAPHEASSLAREVIEAFAPAAAEQGVQLLAEVAPDAPRIQCDRDRIVQVLSNLLANALHVSPNGASVTVSVVEVMGEALFSVKDQGPGIRAEELPGLFDRYSRGRSARYKGAGLGLAIARKIVELHGGQIWVESTPGRGSTFRFRLPMVQAETRPGGLQAAQEEATHGDR